MVWNEVIVCAALFVVNLAAKGIRHERRSVNQAPTRGDLSESLYMHRDETEQQQQSFMTQDAKIIRQVIDSRFHDTYPALNRSKF